MICLDFLFNTFINLETAPNNNIKEKTDEIIIKKTKNISYEYVNEL